MKTRITVGPVDIRTEGLALNLRELRAMMKYATEMALAVIEKAQGDTEDTPEPQPMGFSVITQIADITQADTLDDDE